jgi:fused signal recognition particle receptor
VTEQVVESELPHSEPVTPAVEARPKSKRSLSRTLLLTKRQPPVRGSKRLPLNRLWLRPLLKRRLLKSCRRKTSPLESLVEDAIAQPVVAEAVAGQTPEAVTDEPQVAAVDDAVSDERAVRNSLNLHCDEELEALALAAQPIDEKRLLKRKNRASRMIPLRSRKNRRKKAFSPA